MTDTSEILAIAHRGHSISAPENTASAFQAAILHGADVIETDVRATRDGTAVLLHDARVDRTTDGVGFLTEYSYDELSLLDAGGWFGAQFAGERIPTLHWLLEFADRESVALCLEVKGETEAEHEQLALRLALLLRERDELSRHVLASFDQRALKLAAAAVPGLRIAPDRLPERGPSEASDLIEQARMCEASILQHHCDDLTASVVSTVQAAGVDIWAWPATSQEQVRRMVEMGVAGIMGDDVTVIVDERRRALD